MIEDHKRANGARVTEGQEITPIKVNVTDDTDKNPTVEVTGLPKGLRYNKETGKIEGTPDKLTNCRHRRRKRLHSNNQSKRCSWKRINKRNPNNNIKRYRWRRNTRFNRSRRRQRWNQR
ncbi:MAG: Ig domain-containing protein [Anaerococcus obesiensis]